MFGWYMEVVLVAVGSVLFPGPVILIDGSFPWKLIKTVKNDHIGNIVH